MMQTGVNFALDTVINYVPSNNLLRNAENHQDKPLAWDVYLHLKQNLPKLSKQISQEGGKKMEESYFKTIISSNIFCTLKL